jgi:anti-anti-sigma factor
MTSQTQTSQTQTSQTQSSDDLPRTRVHVTRTCRTPVVCCHGDLDVRAAADLRGVLDEVQRARPDQDLIVDARAVTWAGSTTLGVLIAAHRRAKVDGARLSLVNPPAHLVRSLRVTGLHRVLHVTSRPTPPRRCHREEAAAA